MNMFDKSKERNYSPGNYLFKFTDKEHDVKNVYFLTKKTPE